MLFWALVTSLFVSVSHAQNSCFDIFKAAEFVPLTTSQFQVGRENLSPTDPLFRFLKGEIEAMRTEAKFPKVDWNQIAITEQIANGGRGNLAVYKGQWGNRTVAIKVIDPQMRSDSALLREARVLMELNKVNQGIEFLGITRTPEGQLAMVTTFEDGFAVSLRRQSYSDIKNKIPVTRAMVVEVAALGKLLADLGYVYTADMQLLLTKSGRALLIDVEFFLKSIPLTDPLPTIMPTAPGTAALYHQQMILGVYVWQQNHGVPTGNNAPPGLILPN